MTLTSGGSICTIEKSYIRDKLLAGKELNFEEMQIYTNNGGIAIINQAG